MRRTCILLLAGLMVLPVIWSCKKSSEVNPNVPPTDTNVGVLVGNIATNFTETDSQGTPITLESFRGNVILLTFSTMWCGPCRAETPRLVNLYNTYKEQGLEILQCIYQDEDYNPSDFSDLARWINEFGITFIVFNDPDRSTVDTYNIPALPFNVIIDRDFIIRYLIIGYAPFEIQERIESLL